MHRQIVEVIFDRVGAFGAVAFGLIEPWDAGQIDVVVRVDGVQHLLHPVVERLGVKDFVVAPAVHDKGRDMARHGRPMDVGFHRATPADGVPRKQEEPAKALDLVEIVLALIAANLNPVFLDQERHEVPAIAAAVALDPADLVKERAQDPRIRVAHTGERVGAMVQDVVCDWLLAVL